MKDVNGYFLTTIRKNEIFSQTRYFSCLAHSFTVPI